MADNKKISKIKIGTTTYDIKDPNQPAAIEFDSNYDASTNKAATVQTVVNKINALDGGTIGTPGAGKTITALSQTNGNVSATFGNISITKSQVSDFPNSMPASDVYSWAKASSKPSYTYSEVGAAASDHTHNITLATDTGTSTVTLASAGKYKLTAGGQSVIFTMPTIPTVNYPVTSVNNKTGAVSLTYSDVSAASSTHTHDISLATSTGTSTVTLASAGKYALTAGGKSVIFTMPTIPTVSYPVTSVNTKTGAVVLSASDVGAIASSLKGANNGVAELDSSGKIPSSQLPSFVDDVLEYTAKSDFPATGETGKIYVDKTTNLTWRWSGSAYVEISPSLALGETSSTAYRGDRGKTAYDHSQATHARTDATKTEASSTNGNIKINGTETTVYTHPGSGTNPHGTTKSDVGLGNVGNFKAVSTVASQGLTDTEKSNARANIGAGTSNLTIGTTSSTAAAGNHTHTTTLASDTGTSTITLASAGKYKLTAGGTSVIFTMPTIPTVSYPVTSVAGKTGDVTLTNSDVGLGNVGNFKAVSTVASQGLTNTEKSNARANIGAGTSSLTIGTTASTAAAGNHSHAFSEITSKPTTLSGYGITDAASSSHTHTLTIASDTGTSSLDMAANTKYKITAGGNSFVFKTPADSAPVTSVNNKTGAVSLTYSDVGAQVAGNYASSSHTHDLSIASSSGTSALTMAANTKYQLTAGGKTFIFTTPPDSAPVTSVAGKTGAVTLTNSDVGLGNVGNFKAVSTVASQNLTSTEQANARANIGAGTSSLTIGTTATTAAAGNHTHTLSLATSTGNPSINLAANTKYQLSAGGSTYIFTTPPDTNDNYYHTTGSWSGLTYTATANGGAGALAFTIPTGTTSTTVAKGDHTHTFPVTSVNSKTGDVSLSASDVGAATSGHTHTTSLATDTGTSSITLASAGKYKLTAGGTSVVFTMPTIPSVSYPVTSVNNKTGAVSLTASDVGASATDEKLALYPIFPSTKDYYPIFAQESSTTDAAKRYCDYGNTGGLKYWVWNYTDGGTTTSKIAHLTLGNASDSRDGTLRLAKNGFETSISGGNITANRSVDLPDKSGTIALTDDIPADEKLAVSALTERGSTLYYPLMGATIAGVSINTANTRVYDYGLHYTVNSEGSNGTLTVGNNTVFGYPSSGKIYLVGADGGHTIQSGADNNGVFTATLPKKSGTVALTSDIPDVSGKIDTAGTGLSKSGTTLNHSNSVTAVTTAKLYPVKFDAQGHITGVGSEVTSLPASDVSSWAKASTKPSYTASEVGLGNVGNFKAVSTVANQGLTSTEQSNARTNIGAGTSNLTIGTTGSTAAAGNHTHDYSSTYAAKSHTHGNIQNGGTLQTNDITIASGDKLVVTDSSDSSKIARTSISFDGSTTTKALTQKGTWETFGTSNLAIGTTGTTAAAGNHTHTTTLATDTGTSTVTLASAGKYKLTAGGSSVIFTMPTIPTVNYPVTSVNSQTGAVSLSASDVGAATSNHTHTLSMATSSGTSSISLSANTKYQLTAGGSTYIFTTPVDNNTWNANSATVAGYVASPASTPGVTWKTNSSGTPNWQNEYYFQLSTTDALYTAITNAGWVNDVIV